MRSMNKNIQDKFQYPVSLFFSDEIEFLMYEDEQTLRRSNFTNYGFNFNTKTKIYDKNGKLIECDFNEILSTSLFGLIKNKSQLLTLRYSTPEVIDADGFKYALIQFLEKQEDPVTDTDEVGMQGLTKESSLGKILDRAIDYAVAFD